MARNAMVSRLAAMAAVAAVAVAMSAGNAEARRAYAANAEAAVSDISLMGRLADIGGRFTTTIQYGKAGWGSFRLRAQDARVRLAARRFNPVPTGSA